MSEVITGTEILVGEVISEHPVSKFEKEAKNEIAVIIKDLEPETSAAVSAAYLNFLAQAKEWKDEALAIVVTDASQKEQMKAAKELRLTLQKVRTGADKVRKTLKDDSNKYGKAVQTVYNEIENLIAPLEKHLMDQEKFVEVQEAKRKAAIREERISIINSCEDGNIAAYIPFKIDLAELSETEFQNLYDGAKLQLTEKIRKETEEKVLRFRQEKIAQLGLRLCDDIYSYRDIKFHKADLVAMTEAGFEDAFLQAKNRREALDKEDAARAEEDKAERARIERERDEAKKKADDERAAREETDKINKDLTSRTNTTVAPLSVNGKNDVEKLQSLANLLRSLQIPVVESEEAKTILRSAVEGIKAIAETLESDIAWMR